MESRAKRRWRAAVHQQYGPAHVSRRRSLLGVPCEPALAPLTRLARIVAFGQSTPPAYDQIKLWTDYYADHVGHDGVAERVWRRADVRTRHLTACPVHEDDPAGVPPNGCGDSSTMHCPWPRRR